MADEAGGPEEARGREAAGRVEPMAKVDTLVLETSGSLETDKSDAAEVP